MSAPVVATKLYVPRLRPNAVARPHLIERLQRGIQGKLTLICAPAGFGKTTLAAAWAAELHETSSPGVAWLSLDTGDNDAAHFLTCLVAALQSARPGLGAGALQLLQSPQPAPLSSILAALINELAALDRPLVLILDDYHLISTPAVDELLTLFLEHLPPEMHLVITGRSEPRLPLARLRSQGDLAELRTGDLRFTTEEASTFLNEMMGLRLSSADIAALDARTEGWIAGLQLAALSMEGRADTGRFVRAFAGSHRFVLDYLIEEVLRHQAEDVRRFLLQTAILDRLSGPLCDAVIDGRDSRQCLEFLERSNLFVVPLDDRRHWYRYHHLFADVLAERLSREDPELMTVLHRRASAWYEHNGHSSEAVHHALAAGDIEHAAALVESAWLSLRRTRREASLLIWMRALPESVIAVRPELCVAYAWALLDAGDLDGAERRLRAAEGLLTASTALPDGQTRRLAASIANARGYRAQAEGNVSATVAHIRQALDLLPEDEFYERGTASALLGLACWTAGELEPAYRYFADGLTVLAQGGGTLIFIGGTVILANMATAQGRLRHVAHLYRDALSMALGVADVEHAARADRETVHRETVHRETKVLPGAAELYLGLSELHWAWGNLEEAQRSLRQGKALGDQASLPGYEYLWRIVPAQIAAAQGDFNGALMLLDEAERLYYRSPIPNVRPITAMKARIWIRQGRLDLADFWVGTARLTVNDELAYLREYEHLTLARLLIARGRAMREADLLDPLHGFLARLLHAAEDNSRTGSQIEILMLQALAFDVQEKRRRAEIALGRALALAEPEGYVRLFADEGDAMAALLARTRVAESAPGYVSILNVAIGADLRVDGNGRSHKTDSHDSPSTGAPPLVEPLTPREHQVLRLFATELSGPDIARELDVALSTVRTHTKSIYAKLNVNSRRAAVNRARDLGLI